MVAEEKGVKTGRLARRLAFPVFVAAVAVFAYYESRRAAREQLEEAERAAFLSENLEDLRQIRLKSQSGEILLARKDREWLMEKPLKDLASLSEISRWFEEIKGQEAEKISIKGEIDWKSFHLEEGRAARAELVFSAPKGAAKEEGGQAAVKGGEKTVVFFVGRRFFDGRFYLRRGGNLLLGERHFETEINKKDPDSFRSRKILPSWGHAKKIVFKGKERVSLAWSDYQWSLEGGDDLEGGDKFPLNETELKSFWSDLAAAEAEALKPSSPAARKKLGLGRPQAEIFLDYGRGADVRLKISRFQNGKAHVFSSRRDFLFEVSEDEAKKWLLSEKKIRDHKAPFRFAKDKAAGLELRSPARSYTLKKAPAKKPAKPRKKIWERSRRRAPETSKKVWTAVRAEGDGPDSAGGGRERELDQAAIKAVLAGLRDLEGKKYKKPQAWLSGKKPSGGVYFAVRDKAGELLFELQELEAAGDSLAWVQTSLSKSLAAVSKSALKSLAEKKIYKPAPPPAEESSAAESSKSSGASKSLPDKPEDKN